MAIKLFFKTKKDPRHKTEDQVPETCRIHYPTCCDVAALPNFCDQVHTELDGYMHNVLTGGTTVHFFTEASVRKICPKPLSH